MHFSSHIRSLVFVLYSAFLILANAPAASDEMGTPSTQSTAVATPQPMAMAERLHVPGNTTVVKLANGMTVIVKPTRHAPVVCVRAYVRAGGLYEREWLGAGISHLTEHLVAKGAVHHTPGANGQATKLTEGRMKEIGGQSNAYTTLDHTCYYISAAAGKTNECIDLLADWLARAEISKSDFQREHGVVQRELEMGLDNPSRQMQMANAASFFANHPAAVPVIGYATPLSKLTYGDVLAYHRRMYVPQNMVFVVAGDVHVKAVLDRISQAFSGFEAARTPELALPDVSPISGVRRIVKTHKALKEVLERISFRTIPLLHKDLHALDVLSFVLAKGPSSRLFREVQRNKKLTTAIGSSSWTPSWGTGMFMVSFRAEPANADLAHGAVMAELRTIAEEGIDQDELDRAKRQKLSELVYSQQTVESIAATLAGDYLATRDVNFSRRYTDHIQAVTTTDVQAVARKYFTFDDVVITRLQGQADQKATADSTDKIRQETNGTMFKLPNGLRVVLCPIDAVGLVSMAFVSRGGVLLETENTNGLGALMTSLTTKGAGGMSAEEIAKFFDRSGGSISGNCGNNTFYWQGTVLDDSFQKALKIFADIVTHPDLSESELEIIRPVMLGHVRQQDEHWHSQLTKFFRGSFFTDSPYRLLPVGNEQALNSFKIQQVSNYHSQTILAGSSVLAVYGNFQPDQARRIIATAFADLPSGSVHAPSIPARQVPDNETHTLKTTNEVAAIMVAAPGMKLTDISDRFAIDVLDTIISGWRLPEGWLHEELRGKRLVYVVHAYNWAGLAPGAFQVYAACQAENAQTVVNIIKKHLDKAAGYKPTQREVDLAVNAILTAELLDKQDMPSLAISAALDELYGFGYDFRRKIEQLYRRVTPDDVLRVGRQYLGKGYVVTITRPPLPVDSQETHGETSD